MTTTEKPIPSRPYSKIRGKREISVTEALSLRAVPGLPWGSAKETALFAYYHQEDWINLPPDKAVDRLRMHHRGVWDGRASMGTVIHAVMEAWVDGRTVDLRTMVYDMAANDRQAKSWLGVEDEKIKELEGYVNGLEKFWLDFAPTDIEAETVVRWPGAYIGTRDLRCTIRGEKWLLDTKSTGEKNAEKGIYGDTWCSQLVAYDRAPEVVYYGWDEKGKIAEMGVGPNERAERLGIIHLRGDDNYTLYEVQGDDDAFHVFMDLVNQARWLKNLKPPTVVKP